MNQVSPTHTPERRVEFEETAPNRFVLHVDPPLNPSEFEYLVAGLKAQFRHFSFTEEAAR